MIRTATIRLLAALSAHAQMQLLLVDAPGSEKPVSGLHHVGSTAVGERVDTVVRVRNTSQAQLTIRTLTVAGTGFTMFGQPSLPHVLAPGLNMDFTVRFSPKDYGSYSANVNVNGVSLLLTGSSTAAPVVNVDGAQVPSGSTVDVGRAERGTTLAKAFRLENTTSERVTVQSISVTGAAFRLVFDGSLPMALGPRSGVDFQVAFTPAASGVAQGSLVIDGRTYRLTAAAHEPPFPKPTLLIELPSATSGQQGKVSVQFGEASKAVGTGQLRMEFRSAVPTAPNDEAVRFTKGNRLATFDVAEGATAAGDITFQTGTTAGTIMFIAEVGGWTATASVDIAPQRVHIEKTRAVRNGSMLELEITGYDNTRTLNQLSFTFFGANSQPIAPGAIKVEAGADFRRYFEARTTTGGAFTLKAVFPVAGPIGNITATEIEVTNTSGAAQSGKTSIQ